MARERAVKRTSLAQILPYLKEEIPHGRLIEIEDENVDRGEQVRSYAQHQREIFREKYLVRRVDTAKEIPEKTDLFPPHGLYRDRTQLFSPEKVKGAVQRIGFVLPLRHLSRFIRRNVMK